MTGPSPLRRSQLLGLPLSGLLMGPLAALAYARPLGGAVAMVLAVVLSLSLLGVAGWMAWRSDYAARHGVAGALLFVLLMAPLLGGMSLAAATMSGAAGLAGVALVLGAATAIVPMAGVAWRVLGRLNRQGAAGEWARSNLDPEAGAMRADALMRQPADGESPAPWLVGALAVNLLLAWRVQGGSDVTLMPWVVALLGLGVVWAAVAQVGPALGKSLFVLQIERATGLRYRHEHWAGIQALRRGFWLSRWMMAETPIPVPPSQASDPPRRRGRSRR